MPHFEIEGIYFSRTKVNQTPKIEIDINITIPNEGPTTDYPISIVIHTGDRRHKINYSTITARSSRGLTYTFELPQKMDLSTLCKIKLHYNNKLIQWRDLEWINQEFKTLNLVN